MILLRLIDRLMLTSENNEEFFLRPPDHELGIYSE